MIAPIALLLVLAACGGGGPTAETDDDADAAASSEAGTPGSTSESAPGGDTADADGAESADGAADGDIPQTLEAFFGYGEDFDGAAEEARFRQQEADIQEEIRQCMVSEGWEYTPYVPDVDFESFSGPFDEDLTEEEFAAKYGFGISTMFLEQNDPGNFEEYDPTDDPNYVYRESLASAEQEAYDRALNGTFDFDESDIEYDDGGNEIYPEYEPSGCMPLAYEEAYGGGEQQAVWEELGSKYEELYERIEADPRVVEVRQQWNSCMRESSYEFADEREMYGEIEQRMEPFYEALWGGDVFFEGDGLVAESEAVEGGEPETFEPPSLTPEQEADLAELNDYEIGVATANIACRAGFDDIYQEVSQSYEAEFIRDNLELLTQAREAEGG